MKNIKTTMASTPNSEGLQVNGSFLTQKKEIASVSTVEFLVPENATTLQFKTDKDVEIRQSQDAVGYPVPASEELFIGIAKMSKIFIKTTESATTVNILWGLL